jgi:beta-1,2-mannosidase
MLIKNFRRLLPLLVLLLPWLITAQEKPWMFGPFERPAGINPIITPGTEAVFYCPMYETEVHWEEMATFNPASVVRDNMVYVLYRAEDKRGEMIIGGHTSRLGLAVSGDGLNFTRNPEPVMYPDHDSQKEYEWPGGVEDPRIVETEGGEYVMTYTQWNREVPRLAIATSYDLLSWKKHGPAFAGAYDGKYLDLESKAGSIICRLEGNRLIPEKINGKYWMYFNVPYVHVAVSDDLVNWTPLEDDRGDLLVVLNPRPGYFDAWLVEPGPPAVITENGILMIYNAGNSKYTGVPELGHRLYTGGQALYDTTNPIRLIDRSDKPFIRPEEEYERTGQYEDGTTFLEGLSFFRSKWFIYYGTADSRVAVVVWDPAGN